MAAAQNYSGAGGNAIQSLVEAINQLLWSCG